MRGSIIDRFTTVIRHAGASSSGRTASPAASSASRPASETSAQAGPPLRTARAEVATAAAVMADVAVVAEPGLLKGRYYGNLVVVGVAPGDGGLDLASPALARALRSLAPPAHVLRGAELRAFAAGAAPLRDA